MKSSQREHNDNQSTKLHDQHPPQPSSSGNRQGQQQDEDVSTYQKKNTKQEPIESIREALSILNNAVEDEGSQMKKMIVDDYENLKNILSSITPELLSSLKSAGDKMKEGLMETTDRVKTNLLETKDKVMDYSTQKVKGVDKNAHDRPWAYVGGALFSGFLVGQWLGRKAHR